MILIGMYDSPFVRRVAIALPVYAMEHEHRNWSVFRTAAQPFSPLMTPATAR